MKNRGKVLVAGAAGGIGQVLAEQLLAGGYGVIGSVMNQSELDRVSSGPLSRAKLFVADFSSAERGLAQVKDALTDLDASLYAAVNCFGLSPCGPLECTPISVLREVLEVNVAGSMAIYQATLPYLRKAKGRLVLVSSLAGKIAMPLLGYYSASKYALEGLADTMRLEAGQWDVKISLIQPGGVATGMASGFNHRLDARLREMSNEDRANYQGYFDQQKAFGASPEAAIMGPDTVAAAIVKVLEADLPKARYPLGIAKDLLEARRTSTDDEIDTLLNQMMPGFRTQ